MIARRAGLARRGADDRCARLRRARARWRGRCRASRPSPARPFRSARRHPCASHASSASSDCRIGRARSACSVGRDALGQSGQHLARARIRRRGSRRRAPAPDVRPSAPGCTPAARARARIAAGVVRLRQSTLCTTGMRGAANGDVVEALARGARPRAAAATQWNGALTPAAARPRLAPRALQPRSPARPPRLCPAMTTWPGALKFTGFDDLAVAPRLRRTPRDRVVVEPEDRGHRAGPAGTASCIACARKRTSGTRVARTRARRPRPARRIRPGCARPPPPASGRRLRAMRDTSATPAVEHHRLRVDRAVERLGRALGDELPTGPAPSDVARPRRTSRARPAMRGEARSSCRRACEPCPGNTNASFIMFAISLDYQRTSTAPQVKPPPTPASITCWPRGCGRRARRRRARAESTRPTCWRGDRRSRSPCSHRQPELLRRRLDDAHVGLVRDQPVDVAALSSRRRRAPRRATSASTRTANLNTALPVHLAAAGRRGPRRVDTSPGTQRMSA